MMCPAPRLSHKEIPGENKFTEASLPVSARNVKIDSTEKITNHFIASLSLKVSVLGVLTVAGNGEITPSKRRSLIECCLVIILVSVLVGFIANYGDAGKVTIKGPRSRGNSIIWNRWESKKIITGAMALAKHKRCYN